MRGRTCGFTLKNTGRVAHYSLVRGYVPGDHSAHADDRSFPDLNRLTWRPLPDHRSRPDVCVAANTNVPVAVHAGPESHVIADLTVVRDVAVDIALELATDAGARCHARMSTEHRANSDLDAGANFDVRVKKPKGPQASFNATPFKTRASMTVGDGQDEPVAALHR